MYIVRRVVGGAVDVLIYLAFVAFWMWQFGEVNDEGATNSTAACT